MTIDRIGRRRATWLAGAAFIAVFAAVVVLLPRATTERPVAGAALADRCPANARDSGTHATCRDVPAFTPADRQQPSNPSPPNPFDDEIVREGDLVSVTGQIIDWSAGPVICTWMAWDLSNPPQPGCFDARALHIIGVDPRDLPGADWRSAPENFDNVWVTNTVRVFGTWRDGTIEYVDSIPAERPPSPFSSVPVPCAPPPGGWPGDPNDVADSDILRRRLQTAVDQRPELYGGSWSATSRDSRGHFFSAMVVGTVGEVSSVETYLREIFPANLCVIQVEYNSLELQAEEKRLSAEDRDWVIHLDPMFNRVSVWLPAILDQSTADLLAQADGKVRVFPIAERLDADPPPRGERICGRVDANWCAIHVALVREARPELFGADSVEVVESSCAPGWGGCSFLAPYMVVVMAPDCTGGPLSFSVRRHSTSNLVSEYEDPLPAHIAEMLPAECAVDAPP